MNSTLTPDLDRLFGGGVGGVRKGSYIPLKGSTMIYNCSFKGSYKGSIGFKVLGDSNRIYLKL